MSTEQLHKRKKEWTPTRVLTWLGVGTIVVLVVTFLLAFVVIAIASLGETL